MRARIGVIGLYLVVTLALPLYAMLSKSFSTYEFDLSAYAFQVDEGSGWGTVTTAAELNQELGAVAEDDLQAVGDARLAATEFFPDFSR